jgi:ubiquinone/menaquinone biosynthesis C-methylase UbiE
LLLLNNIRGKYSEEFFYVLSQLLQYFAKDRYGYKELKEKLDKHYNQNTSPFMNSKTMELSSMSTCNELLLKEDTTNIITPVKNK